MWELVTGYGVGTRNHLNVQNPRDGYGSGPVAQGDTWFLKPVLTSRGPRGWGGSLLSGSWLGGLEGNGDFGWTQLPPSILFPLGA